MAIPNLASSIAHHVIYSEPTNTTNLLLSPDIDSNTLWSPVKGACA